MKEVFRPPIRGFTGRPSLEVAPWVEYADYLEQYIAELEWMREGLEK